jgi:hypothetical protein
MAGHRTPVRSARVTAPTDRHQLALVASPPRIGLPPADPHQIVSAGEDVLYLQCAGGDLTCTVVIEHHAAAPGGITPPEGAVGEPDAVSEVTWQINSGHLIIDNYDLGFDPVPDLGVSPGLWVVRAAVWGRDAAAEIEEQWDERLATDPDALDPDTVATPLSPEIWLVQMWPAGPDGTAVDDGG